MAKPDPLLRTLYFLIEVKPIDLGLSKSIGFHEKIVEPPFLILALDCLLPTIGKALRAKGFRQIGLLLNYWSLEYSIFE